MRRNAKEVDAFVNENVCDAIDKKELTLGERSPFDAPVTSSIVRKMCASLYAIAWEDTGFWVSYDLEGMLPIEKVIGRLDYNVQSSS